ncbi:MAG: response regulator [Pseudomonadota bacterium]
MKTDDTTRFETIQQLSSQLAHDFRSLLSTLQWYFKDHMDDKESLEMALESVDSMDKMVKRFSDFEDIDSLHRFPISIRELFDTQVKAEITGIAQSIKAKLNYYLEEELWAHLDDYKIGRMIVYLVENSVRIIDHEEGMCNLSIMPEHMDLIFRISNNCSAEKAKKIVNGEDAYFTRKTMLNTAYCEHIIAKHAGEMTIKAEDKGVTYIVRLPDAILDSKIATEAINYARYIEEKSESSDSSSDSDSTPKPKLKEILVVDDDPSIIKQWTKIISQRLNKIPIAFTQPDEVENVDFKKISAAIVDYQFDNSSMTGIDMIRLLKRKGVMVIHLCTGNFKDSKLRQDVGKLNISSIIPKPLSEEGIKQFLSSLDTLIV